MQASPNPDKPQKKKIYYYEITKGQNHEKDHEPQIQNKLNSLQSQLRGYVLHGSEAFIGKASMGEGVVLYSEPLVTQHMEASGLCKSFSGMRLVIRLHQPVDADMCILLRRRQALMTQQLLHDPQISTGIQHMCCKRVTKCMW